MALGVGCNGVGVNSGLHVCKENTLHFELSPFPKFLILLFYLEAKPSGAQGLFQALHSEFTPRN